MISKEKLVEVLMNNYPEVVGVCSERVDHLIKENNIPLRPEHRSFFVLYGNTTSLITSMFADCTFDRFEQYYLAQPPFEEIHDEEKVPSGTIYFGHDFNDEFLCIENNTGEIYVYGFQEKEAPAYYENIDSFLIYCFFWLNDKDHFFEIVKKDIVVENIEQFKLDNEAFKIKKLKFKGINYYYYCGVLIEFNAETGSYNLYKGGILNCLTDLVLGNG